MIEKGDIDKIVRLAEQQAKRNQRKEQSDGRPLIQIIAGELPRVVDDAETALLAADTDLYQRGGMIVKPSPCRIEAADDRKFEGLRIRAVTWPYIVETLTRLARFQKYDARAKKDVACDCPKRIAETYLARENWSLPVLTAIVHAPILRPDGTILDQPGYDAATGILYIPATNMTISPIPSEPTREEASAALNLIESLYSDDGKPSFGFVTDADQSVATSAILTPFARRAFPTAPIHAYSAPVAGSGKTKLADIVAMISNGEPARVSQQGKKPEEAEKRLAASLIAGDTIIAIDNCSRALGGDLLCQATTQQVLRIRVLGVSMNIDVPNVTTILATGNNLAIEGDATRRALRCAIDPQCENPETRQFNTDPVEVIRADRGRYIAAVLTILRAFVVAGKPGTAAPLGSFEGWSRFVRNAIIWLGRADPCDTIAKVKADDPEREQIKAVFDQWKVVLGAERRVTVSYLVKTITERADDGIGSTGFANQEFRDAVLAIAGDGANINNRRLGQWLNRNQGRIVDKRRIVKAGIAHGGGVAWRLDAIDL